MPKLWIMSDLHLERVPYPDAFDPPRPAFDVLVVAGDVMEGDCVRALAIVSRLARGQPAVFVLGNHEHWDGSIEETRARARDIAEAFGVTLLDGASAEIAGIRFVGATLWADGHLGGLDREPDRPTGERIDVAGPGGLRSLTTADMIAMHRQEVATIEELLAPGPRRAKVVAVTHHAPHPLAVPASLRDEPIAGLLASDLSRLTDAGLADLWIHGHVHETIDLVRPGGTRILCNPAGVRFSNPGFVEDLVVEV